MKNFHRRLLLIGILKQIIELAKKDHIGKMLPASVYFNLQVHWLMIFEEIWLYIECEMQQ